MVLAAVQEYISSCPIKSDQFPDGPALVDGGTSQSPTLQDGTVQSSPPTVAAPGRFDSIVANTPASSVQSRPSRQSIPTSIDLQVKSYSDALRSSMSANCTSLEGDLSDCGTVTTGNTSKKSAREIALESENAELKAIIYDLKTSHNELSNELSTIKSLLQSMSMSGMTFAPSSSHSAS